MKNIIIALAAFLLILPSCAHDHDEHSGHDHGETTEVEADHAGHDHGADGEEEHEEGIFLTRDQMKTVGVIFGDISQSKINDYISATGTLGLPPNAYSSLSAKAKGFIKSSNKYVEGSYVKKGERMAYLENPDFIQHQQEYLEVEADLTYLQQELTRQKALIAENAGVEKNVQKLQSEVNRRNATLKGLSKQLAYLGINTDNLTAENIVNRISILSPMSGYLTSIDMHNGMFVTPQKELMEIVSEKHLHLELDVFEKDMSKVKEEQKVSYTVPALGDKVYEGEVHVIGKEFNTQNKTIRIHGHLGKDRPRFVKDLFVNAKIWLNDQTVAALPEKAVIKDGAFSYIYAANDKAEETKLKFEPLRVKAGTTENGFTSVELIDKIPEGMRLVTGGAYFVYAQSKAGELAHEH
ncbi:MAG: cobalt-zinc-cadmium efflux system membrane fusion protein [Saprospiraceae bacterium]|jgi:cobalt-zinc-cadmium efflux system membrane fusion protein